MYQFVFGQANIPGGVGVFSFCRYFPKFYDYKRLISKILFEPKKIDKYDKSSECKVYNNKNEFIAIWKKQYAKICVKKGWARYKPNTNDTKVIIDNDEQATRLVPNPFENGADSDDNNDNDSKDNSDGGAEAKVTRKLEELLDDKTEKLFFLRCIKVLVHEIGHLFGLKHCVYFECIMNGSNHLQESDSKPVYLCPICLHKLYFCRLRYFVDDKENKLDLVKRYEKLAKVYYKYGLFDESKWFESRVEFFDKKACAKSTNSKLLTQK